MDAVLLGPGLGRSEELTRLVQAVLSICRVPLVLDADGINAAAPHIDVLRGCACPVVLTPHDGEFLRLGGDPKAADRTQEAMRLANRTHAVLLLKGSRTVITDGLNIYVNHTGNPGLATGGSGDVLAGMIVSLLGQHIMPLEAAAAAAWLHGAAADLAAEKLGGVWHGAGGSAVAHSATSAIRVIFVAKKTGTSSLRISHTAVCLLG